MLLLNPFLMLKENLPLLCSFFFVLCLFFNGLTVDLLTIPRVSVFCNAAVGVCVGPVLCIGSVYTHPSRVWMNTRKLFPKTAAASPFAIWFRKTLLARHEDMLFPTVLS